MTKFLRKASSATALKTAIFVFIQYTFPFSLRRSKRPKFRFPKAAVLNTRRRTNSILENADNVFEAYRNLEFEVEKPTGIMKYQKTNRTEKKMNGENLFSRRGTFTVDDVSPGKLIQ